MGSITTARLPFLHGFLNRKVQPDGQLVHSFRTLLDELGSVVCNRCRRKGAGADEAHIEIETKPSALQKTAIELVTQLSM